VNSTSLRSLTRRALFIGVWLALTFALASGVGLRFNPTPSLPMGIYRLAPGLPEKNDLVSVCLQGEFAELALERGYLEPGSCPSGLRPLLKRLAALPGESVDPSAFPIRSVDSQGRSISPVLMPGVVPPGMALVLADHPGSFDSRYFGFVPLDRLQRVEAVWLWPENEKGHHALKHAGLERSPCVRSFKHP
jgi:conjugative transfer signal peptidase TraF